MNKFQNENSADRLARLFFAELLLIGGYYWLGGAWQIIALTLGVVMLVTAVTGFCAIYKLIGIDTKKLFPGSLNRAWLAIFALIIIALPIPGSYYSNFFTKKFFVEDFNRMNGYYKQTLFNTGQDRRAESIDNYNKLVNEFAAFQNKYSAYKPVAIRSDKNFDADLAGISLKLAEAKNKVEAGDLKKLHVDLEPIRLVFQDILKRNNFSMIGIALVDFHDSMEVLIAAADAKNAQAVSKAYVDTSEKLRLVEEIANDSEIQGLRTSLNAVMDLVYTNKPDEFPIRAAELKSAFIKVYLKRN